MRWKRKDGWSVARRAAHIEARNHKIVAAYVAGETREAIGQRFKMTPRNVSRIISRHVDKVPPDLREKIIRARYARPGCTSPGAPRVILLEGRERLLYNKLRDIIGASAARREFGLAA